MTYMSLEPELIKLAYSGRSEILGPFSVHPCLLQLGDFPTSKTCPHHMGSNHVRIVGDCPHGTDHTKACIPQKYAVYY